MPAIALETESKRIHTLYQKCGVVECGAREDLLPPFRWGHESLRAPASCPAAAASWVELDVCTLPWKDF